jgi:prepilin-type N-terminal cleavage/methylation domain-containing protein
MLEKMKSNLLTRVFARCPRQERGFTVLEVMVVMVIFGMVALIGIPMMARSVVRARVLSQVGVLKQAVATARIRALKQGGGVAVRFLTTNAAQEGGEVLAWVDSDSDGSYGPPNEILVGRWPVQDNVILKPDPDNLLFRLGGGTSRGVLFVANGSARVSESGSVGVGQGAIVVSDHHQNDVRLLVIGGTGTVVQEMRDPESGVWSKEMRFWRY